jgi:polyisoprenyl-phosphate glycosyltransferase
MMDSANCGGANTIDDIEISVVVPAFNEADSIPELIVRLKDVLARYETYEIIIVDDGSLDNSCEILEREAARDPRLRYVFLARNFGHQAALRAGFSFARGKCLISLDADLQQQPEIIHEMVDKWRSGYDVVITLRRDVATNSLFKAATSRAFYWFINKISDVKIDPGSADFRLTDRKIIDQINNLSETNLFFRGVIPWLGFKTFRIEYTPDVRRHGTSKYNLRKMISLSLVGIVSGSIKPLRFSIFLSAIVALFAALDVVYAIVVHFAFNTSIAGWTSVVVAVCIIGSLQLLVLGVIGEYVGRIFQEARKRPAYVVERTNCVRIQS